MMKPQLYQTGTGPRYSADADVRSMRDWRPTIPQMREAALNSMVVGATFFEGAAPESARAALSKAPAQWQVERIAEEVRTAVIAGRVIDFGYMPNSVIMQSAHRGGPMYSHGALAHPFSESWLLYHTWEGIGDTVGNVVGLYLCNLLEKDRPAGGDTEVIELSPMHVEDQRLLMIGDRVLMTPDPENEPIGAQKGKYHCLSFPSPFRLLPGADEAVNRLAGGTGPNAAVVAAAANVLDPFVTALMILHTRGVDRHTISPAPALARARMKSQKPPIPPYDVVNSKPYITAILARRSARVPSQGGTHASPIPHLRMGHSRTYASGIVRLIPDALVMMTDEMKAEFRTKRSHYEVRS